MSLLPELPVLPSLEMPSQNESTTNPNPAKLAAQKPAYLLQSPALSFAESFSTAFTSPGDESDDTSRLGSSSLAPPQSLRKSISVDSFAQYGRDGSRSIRGHRTTSPESPRTPVYAVEKLTHPDKKPWSGRYRGESLSSVHRDIPPPVDSDGDRYDPSSVASIERFRRASLKTQEPPRSSIRGGDLPLPSRSQHNTMTNMPAVSNINHPHGVPSISSSSSLISFSKRPSNYPEAGTGRTRSGSLGYNPPNNSRRMVINTQLPPRSSLSNQDIVLVVIGTNGSGKTTVIRKGLAGWGMETVVDTSQPPGFPRYKRRRSTVPYDEAVSPGSRIEVIEVEAQTNSSSLPSWPQGWPPVDGVVICYDSSDQNSYQPVERLLEGYLSMNLPATVLGCKADLPQEVNPIEVLSMLKEHDTGLIEVSLTSEGKEKMKQSFDWLMKAVLRQRAPTRNIDYRNPASPEMLTKGDAGANSWTNTPPASPMIPLNVPSFIPLDDPLTGNPDISTSNIAMPPSPPLTPVTRTRDLIPELDILPSEAGPNSVEFEEVQQPDSETSPGLQDDGFHQALAESEGRVKKEPRPTQWVHLDELLEKLLFLAVCGDDPTYGTHFLLTYRRFATPRSVLLAMQKRMRQLDNPSGDPMFACFAQMRICHLLETWIRDYPHDFAVKGTIGALNALIKSIISKTHLLHYGSEFLPFLEQLPSLVDLDTSWALKTNISDNDSDDYDDDDDDETRVDHDHDDIDTMELSGNSFTVSSSPKIAFPSRERKPSLPMLLSPSQPNGPSVLQDPSPRQHIKDLLKLAQDVLNIESEEIAQEITRQGVKRFLEIKPRDWLHYAFVSARKNETEPISAFNTMSNHLADWVVSLILCHDKPHKRARQIEKFVEIAQRLRQMNNYSALRAFVAGINIATDDATMDVFKLKSPDSSKNLRSWDVLLQQIRSHRAYRLALRNSKGACIPALEVHMSDLIKAHEGNGDINEADPTKIHWGKFNMMGRFITNILQCQAQCRNSNDYDFIERPAIAELFVKRPVMSVEMQKLRLKSQDVDDDIPTHVQERRGDGLRKIFFW